MSKAGVVFTTRKLSFGDAETLRIVPGSIRFMFGDGRVYLYNGKQLTTEQKGMVPSDSPRAKAYMAWFRRRAWRNGDRMPRVGGSKA